jgi:acetophenone carboxylase
MKIAITMEKKGDSLYFDFDGTSPEVIDRVINGHPLGIIGVNMIYWMGHLFHDLPHNAGILEPIHFKLPEGSIVNASRESPKAGSPYGMNTTVSMIQHLLQKATFSTNPEIAEAAGALIFCTFLYGGLNQYGAPFADSSADTNGAGFGARGDKDGVNVAGSYFAPVTSEPGEVESLEAQLPFLYLYRGFHKDSCGNGRYRGGVGIEWGVSIHDVPLVYLGSFGFASKATITQGLYGGYAIPAMPFVWISDTNLKDMMEKADSKIPRSNKMALEKRGIKGFYESDKFPTPLRPKKEWDIIIGGFGGGGGYGDPIERDPFMVMQDIENGVISHRVARDVYRVVYDERRLTVDEEKTKLLREKEMMDRKKKGVLFSEFEKEWLKKKPSNETLEFYGTWPETKYQSFSYYGQWPGVSEKE